MSRASKRQLSKLNGLNHAAMRLHGVALVPNARKAKDTAPDYLVISRKNGFELGAGWNRISKSTGEEYISVSLSAPEFGTIYGNVAPAPGDDASKKVIIWNPAS